VGPVSVRSWSGKSAAVMDTGLRGSHARTPTNLIRRQRTPRAVAAADQPAQLRSAQLVHCNLAAATFNYPLDDAALSLPN